MTHSPVLNHLIQVITAPRIQIKVKLKVLQQLFHGRGYINRECNQSLLGHYQKRKYSRGKQSKSKPSILEQSNTMVENKKFGNTSVTWVNSCSKLNNRSKLTGIQNFQIIYAFLHLISIIIENYNNNPIHVFNLYTLKIYLTHKI